jgi:hypothetical protein
MSLPVEVLVLLCGFLPCCFLITQLRMDVSLVRSADARAKFFDCSLVPLDLDDVSLDQYL